MAIKLSYSFIGLDEFEERLYGIVYCPGTVYLIDKTNICTKQLYKKYESKVKESTSLDSLTSFDISPPIYIPGWIEALRELSVHVLPKIVTQ